MRFGGWDAELVEVGLLPMPGTYLAPEGGLPEQIEVGSNVLLLRGEGGLLQVDAGSGPLVEWWPGGRETRSLGVVPDRIVLTHLDFDHCGGVLAGELPDRLTLAFPGTRVTAPEAAVAAALASDPQEQGNAAGLCAAALQEAGLLDPIADGGEVAAGVRFRSVPGHRAGHSMLEVGDEFVFLADAVHHELHVPNPELDRLFDDDPELALVSRRAVIERLCDGPALAASHISGFGRITGSPPRWESL